MTDDECLDMVTGATREVLQAAVVLLSQRLAAMDPSWITSERGFKHRVVEL